MDQLSSCYFCGAALDASLDEYPVVPRDLRPAADDRRTVVLCPGCREKLANVVEPVVEAARDDAGVAEETGASADSTPDDGPADPAEEPDEASAATGGDDAPTTADDGSSSSNDVTYTSSTAAGGRSAVSGQAESLEDVGPGGGSGTAGDATADEPSSDAGASAGGGDAAPADAAGADTAPGSGSAPPAGDSGAEAGGGADAGAGGDADATGDDGPSMTALEYNKVMRLLQNREFPVDRAEIRAVATNAYQISESEFDAVIDAAVNRGLVAEENGQIVDGE